MSTRTQFIKRADYTVGNIYASKSDVRGYAYKCIVHRYERLELAFIDIITGDVLQFNGNEYGESLMIQWDSNSAHRIEPSNLIAWPETNKGES